MFAAGPPLFRVRLQHAWDGPSLHTIDGSMLLRPGHDGEAVAGSFPRVQADLATGQGRGSAGPCATWPGPPAGGGTRSRPLCDRPCLVWRRRLPARYASRARLEPHHAGASCMRSVFPGTASSSPPGSERLWPTSSPSGRTETGIDAFSIARFADGVMPDARLWQEFDPGAGQPISAIATPKPMPETGDSDLAGSPAAELPDPGNS